MNNKKCTVKYGLWLLFAIIVLFVAAILWKSTGLFEIIGSVDAFKNYMNGFGEKAYLPFFLVQLLSTIIALIPNNVTAAGGAAIFGMWQSFFISTAAAIIGSIIAFMLAKRYGKPLVNRFVSDKVTIKYEKLISLKGDFLLIIIFLLPFFPGDAICFLAGLSSIPLKKFLSIMLLTRPWSILISTAVGAGRISLQWWAWILIIVLTLLIFMCSKKIEEKLVNIFKFSTREKVL